jgi:hypothetical protein
VRPRARSAASCNEPDAKILMTRATTSGKAAGAQGVGRFGQIGTTHLGPLRVVGGTLFQ